MIELSAEGVFSEIVEVEGGKGTRVASSIVSKDRTDNASTEDPVLSIFDIVVKPRNIYQQNLQLQKRLRCPVSAEH